MTNPKLIEAIEKKIDHGTTGGMELATMGGGTSLVPVNMSEAMELGKLMATCSGAIPAHLRGKPGDCLAVAMTAFRWGMDPYAVANKTYFVNDRIAFEAQLVAAVINTRAPIDGRLKITFEGEGAQRRCTVSGRFTGEEEPHALVSPAIASIHPKNSPLWKSDPDQQLAYYTQRTWARRFAPEILLGIYTKDEMDDAAGMKNITPPPRPERRDFESGAAKVERVEDGRDELEKAYQRGQDAYDAGSDFPTGADENRYNEAWKNGRRDREAEMKKSWDETRTEDEAEAASSAARGDDVGDPADPFILIDATGEVLAEIADPQEFVDKVAEAYHSTFPVDQDVFADVNRAMVAAAVKDGADAGELGWGVE